MRLKITDDAGSTGEYKSHEEYVKTGNPWNGINDTRNADAIKLLNSVGIKPHAITYENGVIRQMSHMEEFRLGFSRFVPFIPGLNVYNSCKIGVSGSDVFGYCKNGQEIQEAKVATFTSVMFAFIGGTSAISCAEGVSKPGPVIVGETMKRVELEASKHIDSKILNDMPEYWNMGLKDYEVTSKMMKYNREWIIEQFRSGRQIIDIGLDTSRKLPSIFYQMEQNMIKNYQKLHP